MEKAKNPKIKIVIPATVPSVKLPPVILPPVAKKIIKNKIDKGDELCEYFWEEAFGVYFIYFIKDDILILN